ncbi:MAG: hypothetical protein QXW10_04230 [Candidatus Micrarchaeaceae archaeon]
MKNGIAYIAPLVVLAMMLVVSSASSAIGISFPKVMPSHVTLYLNDSTEVNFTFTLVNGTAGSTCVAIPNSQQLQADGIYTNVVPSMGTPNFNGTLGITTKPNAVPGNYSVQLGGACADPTDRGIAVVYLVVLSMQKPITVTTVPTTTIPSNTVTTMPTTAPTTVPTTPTSTIYISPPTPSSNSTVIYILVAVVIIAIIIIIAAFLKIRSRY